MTRLVPALAIALLPACAHVAQTGALITVPDTGRRSLEAFHSTEALRRAMASVTEARRVEQERAWARSRAACRTWSVSDVEVTVDCAGTVVDTSVVLSGVAARAITSNQHDGVDEGDIVKRLGDVLIVLRRGRLFTIDISGTRLDSLAVADAFGPASAGIDPDGTWYDELLVWQRTVIVIGYSYARGGTEVGLFDLGDRGELEHRATYHLRSNDYYSRQNYASRLIGDRLVLFTSLWVGEDVDPNAWLPAMRRWDERDTDGPFETIASINRVFQPVDPLASYPSVHALTICSLTLSFTCEATVLLGDSLTTSYVSPTAAYAWTTRLDDGVASRSMLYRLPFDGSPVTAIGVEGNPPDQLAFLEDTHDHLNVVVAHENEVVSLLRLPLYALSDGSVTAPAWAYRPLTRGTWVMARFVGPHLLVGHSTLDPEDARGRRVLVTKWEGTSSVSLTLPHSVERIEAMGVHAVVVGRDERHLSMTAIRLGDAPAIGGTLALPNSSQAEDRSHAFFYREDGRDDGVFGLPIVVTATKDDGDRWDRPSRLLFVQNRRLNFSLAGTLDPSTSAPGEDGCRASCVDWYGNARPIFTDGRVIALSGYDMVEGRFSGGRVEPVQRLDFTPGIGADGSAALLRR